MIVLIIASINFSSLMCQDNGRYTFEEGFIHTKSGDLYSAEEIEVFDNMISFTDMGDHQYQLTDIKLMRVNVGTNVRKGTSIGLLSGLAISLIAVVQVSSDRNQRFRDDVGLRLIGITMGSGLIGSIIGLSSKRYKSIYNPADYFANNKLSVNLTDQGLSLVYSF